MRVCDVYIEEHFLYNKTLTYTCEGFNLSKGIRVIVHVKNRKMVGFVDRVYEAHLDEYEFELKPILSLVDEMPVVNEELMALAHQMAYTTVSPLISCLQTILPNKLRPASSSKKPVFERLLVATGKEVERLTPKQLAFMDKFKDRTHIPIKEARLFYSSYRTLVDKGYYMEIEREVTYARKHIEKKLPLYALTKDQRTVIDAVEFGAAHTYLVHGVTGSGKTEVYLTLAQKALDEGKQVLFLVPEIALTPQMIERVSLRFGEDVAIYHSGLNDQEKYEQYIRIKNHETSIVVGTRSASFLPFDNLGLIIMDEEHDTSYKQDSIPTYHTRDIVTYRSEYHRCPLILGSASPSLGSYARALKGVYTLLKLESRINDSFPEVVIVDTKKELRQKRSAVLTQDLVMRIADRLEKGEKTILLLNRRGFLTFLRDSSTGQVLTCPHCDVSLNYHKQQNLLKCHVCGYQSHRIPTGTDGQPLSIMGSGVGTQRLVEGLENIFPSAHIVRMDRDTTSTKNAHAILLDAFNTQGDILVGTQMIAKGLDNADVTLVGVIDVDAALMHEDYRSVEETFSLILQATGRSGRGSKDGEVVIQTYNPDHYAIVYGSRNMYQHFFKQEMQYRKVANYPPYAHLISITFSHPALDKVTKRAQTFRSLLDSDGLSVMGPVALRKINKLERSRIILKGKDLEKLLAQTHLAMDVYLRIEKGGVRVDVNPLTLM